MKHRKKRIEKLYLFITLGSLSQILTKRLLSYKLDYGLCFLNRMSKINFKIKNKTKDRYFKFEWSSHQNLVCLPAAGHLAPESFKEITATFLAWEPLSLFQVNYVIDTHPGKILFYFIRFLYFDF